METFGARLTTEREARGLTIPSVAQALGVDEATLIALECDDYRALPEQPVVMRCLKGYAQCLEVDAELMIEDFRQERERHLGRRAEPTPEPTIELWPDEEVSPEREAPAVAPVSLEPEPEARAAAVVSPGPEARVESPVSPGPEVPATVPDVPEREAPAEKAGSPGPEMVADLAAGHEPEVASVPPVETVLGSRPRPVPLVAVTLIAAVILALGGAWWLLGGDDAPARPELVSASASLGTSPSGAAPAAADPSESVAAVPRPGSIEPASGTARPEPGLRQPAPAPATAAPAAAEPERPATPRFGIAPATALSIQEFGVGTGVRNRGLVGEGTRFDQGSKVWFWTRVEGGEPGRRIEHVWLEDGVEKLRLTLNVGGSPWRTYSSKTLHPGSSSRWAVEARDEQGRVLARREFATAR